MTLQLERWLKAMARQESLITAVPDCRHYGRLTRATGMVMEAIGLQLPLGATCLIERYDVKAVGQVETEVVGFKGRQLFLMPLENVEGILPGARVYAPGSANGEASARLLPLGPALLGRILCGSGHPLDNLPPPETG